MVEEKIENKMGKTSTVEEKKTEVIAKAKDAVGKVEKEIEESSVEVKPEKKEEKKTVEKAKKGEAKVSVRNIPMSTKHSMALCDFIKKKKIGKAIEDVEAVIAMKKAVPMKGEIPHRKGKGMMSGRFPQNAGQNFLKLLRSLASNAVHNGMEDPVIVEAVANIGERPYGRFGQVRRKRTHVLITAKEAKKK